jgi:hypothetical protein
MPGHAALGWDAMRELVGRFAEMGFAEAVADGWRVVGKIWLPTLFGSIIVGLAVGALGFLLVRWAVARLHRRRAQRAEQWRTRLVPPDPGRTT